MYYEECNDYRSFQQQQLEDQQQWLADPVAQAEYQQYLDSTAHRVAGATDCRTDSRLNQKEQHHGFSS